MKRVMLRALGRIGRRGRLVARLAPDRLGPMDREAARAYIRSLGR